MQIGGEIATVLGGTHNWLRVHVPWGSSGGYVTVTTGGVTDRCGILEVIGRVRPMVPEPLV